MVAHLRRSMPTLPARAERAKTGNRAAGQDEGLPRGRQRPANAGSAEYQLARLGIDVHRIAGLEVTFENPPCQRILQLLLDRPL